jgi:chemotaxis protein histidine kinase CheA
MEELRQEFLAEAISNLEKLLAQLQTEKLSEESEREIFRTLHTLKGTSQTLNLNLQGRLAHEIENLLQAKRENQLSRKEDFEPLLKEGLGQLLEIFRRAGNKKEVVFPKKFVEKLRGVIPHYSASLSGNLSGVIPPQFLSQLSAEEKKSLNSAISNGKQFFLIEAGFEFASFAEKFKELRQILSERGEVVANFPSPKFAAENKIGFQIFFVSSKGSEEILESIQPFGANLILQNGGNKAAKDLKGILEQAILSGERAAQLLGKKVEFEVSAADIEISNKRLKLLSDILLHLVRNAVDHAIEAEGKIKIEFFEQENNLLLRVIDDGRGIDAEKIREKAIAKNLISADEDLTKEETLKLIFAHGFSTSERVTEISGRGVGLDAVEDMVKKAGGEIRVESEIGKGTTFEIRLPIKSNW